MDKIDFKKEFKQYYSPKAREPEIIDMPSMQFVMVDGRGDPNKVKEFEDAVGALYSIVYGLKFGRKKSGKNPDFSAGALEGLWWSDVGEPFTVGNKDDWLWTVMIWLPDFITQAEFDEMVDLTKQKKPNPKLDSVRLENFSEGKVVQVLHIGPYDTEKASVDLMHAFASDQGYTQTGKHHEIYLGDPRRSAPEKLKTIIRHPIKKKES